MPGSCVRPVSILPSMFFHSMNVNATDVPGMFVRLCRKLAPGAPAVPAISWLSFHAATAGKLKPSSSL